MWWSTPIFILAEQDNENAIIKKSDRVLYRDSRMDVPTKDIVAAILLERRKEQPPRTKKQFENAGGISEEMGFLLWQLELEEDCGLANGEYYSLIGQRITITTSLLQVSKLRMILLHI